MLPSSAVRGLGKAGILPIVCLALSTALAADEGVRTVTGQVIDAAGAPVAQATVVVVQADGDHRATTAADGRFAIEGVARGPFTVIAVYGRASVRAVSDGEQPITLRLELRPEEIRIREAPPPPAVQPTVVESTMPRRWPYSDEAKGVTFSLAVDSIVDFT